MASAMARPVEFKPWKNPTLKGNSPSPRQGHACAVVEDKTYLFGGSCVVDETTVYLADLFCLSSADGELIWEEIDQQGETPAAREGHTFSAVGTNIYLLGGTNEEGASNCIPGLWILDTVSYVWKSPETKGPAPEAFSYSAAVTKDGCIVTFGGVHNGSAGNDTHILDTNSLEWVCAETSGQRPQCRCDHGCTVVGRRVAVFGGSAGEDLWLNDLHFLDLDTMVWTAVSEVGVPPHPRDYPAMFALDNRILVVVGGYSAMDEDEKCFSDTWYMDTSSSSLQWQQADKDGTDVPDGRYSHSVAVCNKKLIMFGGINTEQTFDDLWIREVTLPSVSPTIPPRRKYKTTTPIPAPRKVLSAPTVPEVETRNFEKMRSSFITQINDLFDAITNQFQELDRLEAKLTAEREQLEEERRNLHDTYDKQQEELKQQQEAHRKDNEEWIRQHVEENNAERQKLAEEKAHIEEERAELDKEKAAFIEKSTKLDAIMRQVQGLTS